MAPPEKYRFKVCDGYHRYYRLDRGWLYQVTYHHPLALSGPPTQLAVISRRSKLTSTEGARPVFNMIDDSLLQSLPEDPELGFIALINNLDPWLEKVSGSERDVARKLYGETLTAFIGERGLNPALPRRQDYQSLNDWWDDFRNSVMNFKAKCIFRRDRGDITPPNPDLSDEIKDDYEEARSILSRSPRGAAALLRLAIQKLCKELGEQGENINQDIASLVRKGLPIQVQQALDAVRMIGNEAVHPGQIAISDNPAIAATLFRLVNFIAEKMISEPKAIEQIYGSLPPEKLAAIQRRDSRAAC